MWWLTYNDNTCTCTSGRCTSFKYSWWWALAPETCLCDPAEIKPAQCCIKLVFHLTYTMMHGSTKLKFVRYLDSRGLLHVIEVEIGKEATKSPVTYCHISVLVLLWMSDNIKTNRQYVNDRNLTCHMHCFLWSQNVVKGLPLYNTQRHRGAQISRAIDSSEFLIHPEVRHPRCVGSITKNFVYYTYSQTQLYFTY